MSTITMGVDLAKNLFSVCAVDGAGHVQRRQDLGREAFALWLAQVPAGTVVALEACSGAHHWARRRLEVGLLAGRMGTQGGTQSRKSRSVKNGGSEAGGSGTAAGKCKKSDAGVKTLAQKERLI
ncbi:hypothetical protein CSC66_17160 [Pseudoxanthomonas kaohsiungensis]|uniref:hypothetical protein n=1 Tax=Pseudoxanthomonas kaohsiungensis TaxID=283923 RepID=UPI0013908D31|nr:hypothetical protein CSC66_17160 [Pseudoxanthomonas kaohsiungensis]